MAPFTEAISLRDPYPGCLPERSGQIDATDAATGADSGHVAIGCFEHLVLGVLHRRVREALGQGRRRWEGADIGRRDARVDAPVNQV